VNLAAIVAVLMTHRYRDCAGEGWRLGEKKMRHLLTTLAAAAFVVGLGFAIAPAHAAPLPQLNGPGNQASPVEKVGYYGYRRYGYYPRHRYYWRHRYYRPYYGYGYYRPYRYGYWNRPYYRRWW
jgi:hypothetical protein